MEHQSNDQLTFDGPGTYRIRIKGFLDEDRSDWLGGMHITTQQGPGGSQIATLVGRLSDQAALTGILNTIYEMHLPLLSVEHLEE